MEIMEAHIFLRLYYGKILNNTNITLINPITILYYNQNQNTNETN